MLVRHHHAGRVYLIEVPEGTGATLRGVTVLVMPWEGRKVPVFDRPTQVIVQFARCGLYGMRLLGVEPTGTGR